MGRPIIEHTEIPVVDEWKRIQSAINEVLITSIHYPAANQKGATERAKHQAEERLYRHLYWHILKELDEAKRCFDREDLWGARVAISRARSFCEPKRTNAVDEEEGRDGGTGMSHNG